MKKSCRKDVKNFVTAPRRSGCARMMVVPGWLKSRIVHTNAGICSLKYVQSDAITMSMRPSKCNGPSTPHSNANASISMPLAAIFSRSGPRTDSRSVATTSAPQCDATMLHNPRPDPSSNTFGGSMFARERASIRTAVTIPARQSNSPISCQSPVVIQNSRGRGCTTACRYVWPLRNQSSVETVGCFNAATLRRRSSRSSFNFSTFSVTCLLSANT
mmetsp:Transcript_109199/g.250550  ORF Transcript_109199/g.250550 Transcript_109199/m.250550 type:complete len:216 (+) Transcript_109199:842-1489(+)